MSKRKKPAMIREPMQVYITNDERQLLDQVAGAEGISRAEVLRRGLRSYAAGALGMRTPMLDLVRELEESTPSGRSSVAADPDAALDALYLDRA